VVFDPAGVQIKRGTVEGLNPLMFVFALLGNVTYVGRYSYSLPPFCFLLMFKLLNQM
jgi:hypothetical protein